MFYSNDNLFDKMGLEILNFKPDNKEWKGFLTTLFLFLGISFLATGIVFFFAYNWADLSKFSKFALIETAIILSTGVVLVKKISTSTGKGFLLLSIILTGVLLAIFGQTYQTGADAYQLFMGWSLLVVGWVVVSSFLPIWTVFILLINTTMILYWHQIVSGSYGNSIRLYEMLIGINFCFLFLFEFFLIRIGWLKGRWLPRILYITLSICFVIPLLEYIFSYNRASQRDYIALLCPLLFGFFLIGTFTYYQRVRKDLFSLTIALTSCIILFTGLVGRILITDVGGFIFLAFLVIIQGAGATIWLKKTYSKWEVLGE